MIDRRDRLTGRIDPFVAVSGGLVLAVVSARIALAVSGCGRVQQDEEGDEPARCCDRDPDRGDGETLVQREAASGGEQAGQRDAQHEPGRVAIRVDHPERDRPDCRSDDNGPDRVDDPSAASRGSAVSAAGVFVLAGLFRRGHGVLLASAFAIDADGSSASPEAALFLPEWPDWPHRGRQRNRITAA